MNKLLKLIIYIATAFLVFILGMSVGYLEGSGVLGYDAQDHLTKEMNTMHKNTQWMLETPSVGLLQAIVERGTITGSYNEWDGSNFIRVLEFSEHEDLYIYWEKLEWCSVSFCFISNL